MKDASTFLALMLLIELSAFGIYAGYSEVRHKNDEITIVSQAKTMAMQQRRIEISSRLVNEYRDDMKGYIIWKDSLKNKHSKAVEKMEEQYRMEFESDIDRSVYIGDEK